MTLARVTISGTYGGMGHVNVLHFGKPEATSTDYLFLGSYVEDFWIGEHKGNTQSHMQWNNVNVRDMSDHFSEYNFPVTRQGVLGFTSAYIPFLCAVFLFKTETPGRRGRGRSSQGGYDNSFQIQAGLWNTTLQTRLNNVALALKGDWTTGTFAGTGGWRLMVASRSDHTYGEASPVIDIIASTKVGTINTRKIGRGL